MKNYLILKTFLGVLLSSVSVQVEISPLFEQRFPPLEPCAQNFLLEGSPKEGQLIDYLVLFY